MKRFALLAALCLLQLNAPARADEAPAPAWEGVWRGTIDTLPVYVCLDQGHDRRAKGAYYYERVMHPIALDRDSNGLWVERGNGGEAITGRWTLTPNRSVNLSGRWRAGARDLPISLSRVRSEASTDGPCGSGAFLAPRLSPIRQTSSPARLGNFRYNAVRYDVGNAFPDYEIVGLSYPASQPGDAAINRALRLNLLDPDSPVDYRGCSRSAAAWSGVDGFMEVSYQLALVTDNFISVHVSEFGYCGGLSPYNASWSSAYDRQSGFPVALSNWFTRTAAETRGFDDGSGRVSPIHALQPLKRLILRHFPRDRPDCSDVIQGADYWTVSLAEGGLIFSPDLARVAQACGDDASVPFAELAPLLSPAGRRGAERLGWRER